MNYTKKTLRISNPSPKVIKVLEELRRNKMEQLERLHNMKPEDFDIRVSL